MFADARRLINAAIAEQQIPGAVWLAARGGKVLAHEAQGFADPEAGVAVTADTLFDLASLTKVAATLPVVLRLLEQGYIRLDDSLSRLLPEFPSAEVTVRHLLTHTAGFPSGERLWGRGWDREAALAHIARFAPQHAVGGPILYSDISFILLGLLAERITGLRLDEAARTMIFEPLGMSGATFSPGPGAAPTEYREHLGRRQQSEVHDENATALEGVAGHAGLFGTAADLLAYASMWLGWQGPRVLSPLTLAMAARPHAEWEGERRALGWLVKSSRYPSCGDLMSDAAFGHTGFTGTSLWLDPVHDVAVILLTNRVYYGRQDHIIRLRPRFHNAIMGALA